MNMHYSSRKGKKDSKGGSQAIRAAIPTTDPGERASYPSVSNGRATSPVLAGQDTSAQYLEQDTYRDQWRLGPVGLNGWGWSASS